MTLAGRTCIFAGATGNIGEGAVRALAAGGMNVVMVTHNPDRASAIIRACRDLPGTVTAKSNQESFKDILEEIEEKFGSIDVYINKTGVLNAPCSVMEISSEVLSEKLQHQVLSAFSDIQTILPFLKKSRHGRILLCVNGGAVDGNTAENPADSIARGAVISMTRVLSNEMSEFGMTVNAVVLSGMVPDHLPKPGVDLIINEQDIPLGYIGTTEEFGALAAYIASEESGFTTGHLFNLTGGRVIL